MMASILIGIFAGFFLRGIYSRFTISKTDLAMFREVELSCLHLLIMTYEDFHYLKEKKSMMMAQMGVDDNEIKLVKNVDEQNIINWQRTAINKLLLSSPPRLRQTIPYRTWRGAMTYLNNFKKTT